MADTSDRSVPNIMELLAQLDAWLTHAGLANNPGSPGWKPIFDEVAAGPWPDYLRRPGVPEPDPRMVLGLELNRLGGTMQHLVRDTMGLQFRVNASSTITEAWTTDAQGNRLPVSVHTPTPEEIAEAERMLVPVLREQVHRLSAEVANLKALLAHYTELPEPESLPEPEPDDTAT